MGVGQTNQEAGSGITVRVPRGGEVSASDNVVREILGEVDKLYFGTLDRAIEHPGFGAVLLGLIVLVIALIYLSRRERRKLKSQYEEHRKRIRHRGQSDRGGNE
jgi:MOSC domain-containing protein YiiM